MEERLSKAKQTRVARRRTENSQDAWEWVSKRKERRLAYGSHPRLGARRHWRYRSGTQGLEAAKRGKRVWHAAAEAAVPLQAL